MSSSLSPADQKAYNDVFNNCIVNFDALKCAESIPELSVDGIKAFEAIAFKAGGIETACAEVKSAVGDLNKVANGTGDLLETYGQWYENALAPAMVDACATTKSPLTIAEIVDGPKQTIENLFMGSLSKPDRFLIKYRGYIAVAIVVIFTVMLGFLLRGCSCNSAQ